MYSLYFVFLIFLQAIPHLSRQPKERQMKRIEDGMLRFLIHVGVLIGSMFMAVLLLWLLK